MEQAKEITLEEINMQHAFFDGDENRNENWDGKEAILHCSRTWTISDLRDWFPTFSYDALQSIKSWLSDESVIAEGGYLRIWL